MTQTDPLRLERGPIWSGFSKPLRMELLADGDRIADCSVERGYCAKGLEKAIESRDWSAAILIAGRLDNENAVFAELALCQAVEQIQGVRPNERARLIRLLVCELVRISSHLCTLAAVARAAESDAAAHLLLRDRERILDLMELLSGARFSTRFFSFGGIAGEVSEGFLDRAIEVCREIRSCIPEYNDLFTFHLAFLRRAAGIGILLPETAEALGVTGPNARASGFGEDARKSDPDSGYQGFDFAVPRGVGEYGKPGDVHDRVLVRIREVSQSMDLVTQLVAAIPAREPGRPDEPEAERPALRIPPGEAYSRVESPRGLLGCYVVSDGGPRPVRVQFRPAGRATFEALPEILKGSSLQDIRLIVESLGISMSEIDG